MAARARRGPASLTDERDELREDIEQDRLVRAASLLTHANVLAPLHASRRQRVTPRLILLVFALRSTGEIRL
jgi:hypothetical protein